MGYSGLKATSKNELADAKAEQSSLKDTISDLKTQLNESEKARRAKDNEQSDFEQIKRMQSDLMQSVQALTTPKESNPAQGSKNKHKNR